MNLSRDTFKDEHAVNRCFDASDLHEVVVDTTATDFLGLLFFASKHCTGGALTNLVLLLNHPAIRSKWLRSPNRVGALKRPHGL